MNEEKLISLVVERAFRNRYREKLSNPKQRSKILDRLNHDPHLDSRFTKWFSSFDKAVASIDVHSNIQVYILSFASEIDGKTMSFEDAIDQVPYYGWGSIIGVTQNLALYYGEAGECAAVISRES
ncbi:MAG: hypothetical protein PVH19_01510 [Planctomycetia bacterium]|jgi:hypothetical protein